MAGRITVEDIDYTELDPGIRETVRFLRSHGFDTTDSGDGKFKFSQQGEDCCALPFANVAIVISDPITLTAHADRLSYVLEQAGIIVQPIGYREADAYSLDEPPPWDVKEAVEIEASYDPANGSAILMVMYLDDDLLFKVGAFKRSIN